MAQFARWVVVRKMKALRVTALRVTALRVTALRVTNDGRTFRIIAPLMCSPNQIESPTPACACAPSASAFAVNTYTPPARPPSGAPSPSSSPCARPSSVAARIPQHHAPICSQPKLDLSPRTYARPRAPHCERAVSYDVPVVGCSSGRLCVLYADAGTVASIPRVSRRIVAVLVVPQNHRAEDIAKAEHLRRSCVSTERTSTCGAGNTYALGRFRLPVWAMAGERRKTGAGCSLPRREFVAETMPRVSMWAESRERSRRQQDATRSPIPWEGDTGPQESMTCVRTRGETRRSPTNERRAFGRDDGEKADRRRVEDRTTLGGSAAALRWMWRTGRVCIDDSCSRRAGLTEQFWRACRAQQPHESTRRILAESSTEDRGHSRNESMPTGSALSIHESIPGTDGLAMDSLGNVDSWLVDSYPTLQTPSASREGEADVYAPSAELRHPPQHRTGHSDIALGSRWIALSRESMQRIALCENSVIKNYDEEKKRGLQTTSLTSTFDAPLRSKYSKPFSRSIARLAQMRDEKSEKIDVVFE
ncbi:hypothetical protein C8R43DRAFT_942611 [Mycena crocata]|nr:hypothetical protein C8R43DRAFT_942611 [Mycena crocata]